MHLQPLQPVARSQMEAIGDVTIDPTAAIALGVMLVAAPNSRIAIAAGVCIGMGTILQAHGGTIEIKSGATLGSGVLVVGKGTIGANACIGAATTIYNASIEPLQVVPAGSVIGDESRKYEIPVRQASPSNPPPSKPVASKSPEAASANSYGSNDREPEPELPQFIPESDKRSATQEAEETSTVLKANSGANSGREPEETELQQGENPSSTEAETAAPEESGQGADGSEPEEANQKTTIYGQVYVSRMLGTLFPRGQSLNSRNKE